MHNQVPMYDEAQMDSITQAGPDEDLPDLIQMLLYNHKLFAVYEVNIFNSFDVTPLMVTGNWHAIITPNDSQYPLMVQFNSAKTYDDVMMHSQLLAHDLRMPYPVAVKAMYVTGKHDNYLSVIVRREDGVDASMVVEYTEGMFSFDSVH